MGNESSTPSLLTNEEIKALADETPFSVQEVRKLGLRYQTMDPDGTYGILYKDMLTMPEFAGNSLAPPVIASYLDGRSKKIYIKQFLHVCAMLSNRISVSEKKEFLYDLLNIYGSDSLSHDEIFRLFKLFFDGAVSDDHILALTFKALSRSDLENRGKITKEEFNRMITDQEIKDRMTIDLHLVTNKN